MKIYFHASVSRKKEFGKYYLMIIEELRKLGQVDATHIEKHKIDWLHKSDRSFKINEEYQEMLERLMLADIVVCEISFPSTIVVGHILTRALERGKPVLGLFHENTTAALLGGLEMERLIIESYNENNLGQIIKKGIFDLKNLPKHRFTMLVDNKIKKYLDEVSKHGITRSDYIRNLIIKDREVGKRDLS